ncbi:MAG: hypothetical protein MJ224_03745 [archaeon]|nr:hypothetical protein [archaeon]
MKTKKEIQLELLQEIDTISSKYNLNYILYGINGINLYNNYPINEDEDIEIAMTQGDIDRFCKIIEEKYSQNRYVEGIFNNPRLNRLYVKYGNKNTTYFKILELNYEKHNGINISIHPIRKSASLDGKKIQEMTPKLSKEKKIREYLNTRIESPKLWYVKVGIKTLNGLYGLSGHKSKYYEKIKNNIFIDKWEDIQNYSRVRINKDELNTSYLKEIKKVKINNQYINLPKDTESFFNEIDNNKFETIIKTKPNKDLILDTENSYEEVIEELKDLVKEARIRKEEFLWGRLKGKNDRDIFEKVWDLVKMTNKEIKFTKYFKENIDDLLATDLEDEEGFKKIYSELKPVIETLEEYSEKGLTFSIDPKTDELIEKVLIKIGNKRLVNKMKKLKEKEYFIE